MADSGKNSDSFWAKGLRKCQREPWVPAGALVTLGFLAASGRQVLFNGQDSRRSTNLLMRGRVVAQSLTIGAMLLSMYYFGKDRCFESIRSLVI